ncbi:phosphatase PAP2 family protein [Streptomyces sp. NPDC005955]|uniref:phosphatase PAP2 family protein n=1 Tax=Streptomyces sp. NPDC005955 TaxID=3364738 RepID=UPI0036C2D5BF
MHKVSPLPPSSPPRPLTSRAPRVALVLGGLATLLLVLVAARWSPLLDVDEQIARTTHDWAVADPGLTHANRILTDWAWDPWTMRALLAVVVGWLLWRRDAWFAAWLAVPCALGTLLQQALKAGVGRERPRWPDPVDSANYSAFPSGHAMTATVVCGLLLWTLYRYGVRLSLWRVALVVAAVSVLGVGFTRIWLGVHWPSDVVEGWLLGGLTVSVAVLSYERFRGPSRLPDADRTGPLRGRP